MGEISPGQDMRLVSVTVSTIMRYWDKPRGKTLQLFRTNRYRRNGLRHCSATAVLLVSLGLIVACEEPAPVAAEPGHEKTKNFPCAGDGRLTVELYGGIHASIDWKAGDLTCTGMPRPDGEGARVRIAGPLDARGESRSLVFIFGFPDLEVGQTGTELATNVTLIEEGTGRFFGSRDTSDCWTDVSSQEPIGGGDETTYRIEGTLYCVSPLAELNGTTSVTFTELNFTGRLNWEQPE